MRKVILFTVLVGCVPYGPSDSNDERNDTTNFQGSLSDGIPIALEAVVLERDLQTITLRFNQKVSMELPLELSSFRLSHSYVYLSEGVPKATHVDPALIECIKADLEMAGDRDGIYNSPEQTGALSLCQESWFAIDDYGLFPTIDSANFGAGDDGSLIQLKLRQPIAKENLKAFCMQKNEALCELIDAEKCEFGSFVHFDLGEYWPIVGTKDGKLNELGDSEWVFSKIAEMEEKKIDSMDQLLASRVLCPP